MVNSEWLFFSVSRLTEVRLTEVRLTEVRLTAVNCFKVSTNS